MALDTQLAPASKIAVWTGWVLSVLPALMLLMSGAMKLAKPEFVIQGMKDQGWDDGLALGLGIVEITCTLIYLFPRTAVLGAILLTGYLGGAVATHVRMLEPYFIPVILGMLIWFGLYLRDTRLRRLLPLRS